LQLRLTIWEAVLVQALVQVLVAGVGAVHAGAGAVTQPNIGISSTKQ